MTENTQAISKLTHIFLFLTMGLGSVYCWSQDVPEPGQTPESSETETARNSVPVKGDPGKTEPASEAQIDNNSPFDYQASEEISQDLSVSYPVDI